MCGCSDAAASRSPPPFPRLLSARLLACAAPLRRPQAYGKLQFDFPLVRPEALSALQRALSDGGSAALLQFPVTAQLLSAVEEGARPRAADAPADEADAAASGAARRSFQLVAGALFGSALQQLVLADDERADALLRSLHLPPPPPPPESGAAASAATLEATLDALALEPPAADDGGASGSGSDDSDWEDLPPGGAFGGGGAHADGSASADAALSLPLAQRVDAKLAFVGAQLRYELLDMPGVWEALGLSAVLLNLLRTLRARPRPCALHLQALVARMLCDRWVHALDATLPPALHLLAEDASTGEGEEAAAPVWLLARLVARACTAPGSAAPGALWVHVHACLAPVLAPCAEQLSVAARWPATKPLRARLLAQAQPLGDVLSLYAQHAPGGATVGEVLIATGVVRSMVALLAAPGADMPNLLSMRRALLLACAASPAVAAFAAAVPGLSAAVQQPADACSTLWALVLAAPAAHGDATQPLRVLIAAVADDVAAGEAPRAAALLDALLLLTDASQAAGAGRPLLRAGGDVALALKGLHVAMLNRPIAPAADEEEELPASPRAAEAREKQQTKWAALLRAVKDVLAAASSDGARKTD